MKRAASISEASSGIAEFSVPLPVLRSRRARQVARWFGITDLLPRRRARPARLPWVELILPAAGQITLLTGPSGAGKSTVLRAIQQRFRGKCLKLDRLTLPDRPIVDCFNDLPLDQTLRVLSQVGLGEAWTYLRTPAELSDGQRWRLKLAIALQRPTQRMVLADEFAALLDRITARVVARCLRKQASAAGVRVVVATSHTDLIDALSPDILVHCDFNKVCIQRAR